MFDLFRSRDKAVRYLLGGVLGIVALSMVITLVPGFGNQSSAPEPVLAKIGDEQITTKDLRTRLQQMAKNGRVPAELLQVYIPQVLDAMIADRAVSYEARRLGFHISDEETANAIRSVLTQLFPNGQFDKSVYERFLSEQGLTIQDFENTVRDEVLRLRLRNIVLEGVVVTPDEINQEYHRRNDKIKVEYVTFSPEKFKSEIKITDAEAKEYFDTHRAQFMTPEKRSIDVLIGDEQKLAATVQVPEAQLRNAYSQNRERFRVQDRVKVRHILIKTMDKPKEEQAKAEAKANDLLKQIKGGADFAELAKKNSEDPGSAPNGGDLGFVVRGQTVKPFEDAAFSLAPNQLSNVIKTEYGYHILRVEGKENGRLKPFEEVKDEIANELKRQLVQDELQKSVDSARSEMVRNPGGAAQVATKYNLMHVHADNVAAGQPIPEIGSAPELETALTGLKVKEVSNVVQLSPTRLGFAVITGVQPSRQAEFNDAAEQVKRILTDQNATVLAQQKLADAVGRLAANGGGNFSAAAKSLGLEVKSTDFFTRDGAAEGIGQASYLAEAFAKPEGSVVGPINVGDKTVIARVTGKQQADTSGLAGVREDIQLTLKRKKAAERKELFDDGLVTRLVKDGTIKKYPENIKKLEQAYRS